MKEFCVLLDNGHGRETPGKRSPIWSDGSQLLEWETNRKIVRKIEHKLTLLGIKTIVLVPEDRDIGLTIRANRANKYVRDYHCILVSVHCDAFDQLNKAAGWSVYSTALLERNLSDDLADSFTNIFPEVFPDMTLRGHKEKNFTIIYKAQCPAVLTENFFMTAATPDCRLLMSDEGLERIADLHVQAILDFQKSHYPETVKPSNTVQDKPEYTKPGFVPYPMRVQNSPVLDKLPLQRS